MTKEARERLKDYTSSTALAMLPPSERRQLAKDIAALLAERHYLNRGFWWGMTGNVVGWVLIVWGASRILQ